MAKTTAPLLSFGASGQIGKTQVYASWRGVAYARRHVQPANPRTASQSQTRGVFSFLSAVWKLLNPAIQAVWTDFAKGRPFTNRNAFTSKSLGFLRGATGAPTTDLAGLIMSPGVGGGLAPVAITPADAGSHNLTIAATEPDLPAGWSITKCHFVAMKQAEADTSTVYESFYAFDATTPYASGNIANGAATYACWCFFEFLKPDGSTAYGPSLYANQVVA